MLCEQFGVVCELCAVLCEQFGVVGLDGFEACEPIGVIAGHHVEFVPEVLQLCSQAGIDGGDLCSQAGIDGGDLCSQVLFDGGDLCSQAGAERCDVAAQREVAGCGGCDEGAGEGDQQRRLPRRAGGQDAGAQQVGEPVE